MLRNSSDTMSLLGKRICIRSMVYSKDAHICQLGQVYI